MIFHVANTVGLLIRHFRLAFFIKTYSKGQTFDKLGIYLYQPGPISHGQLYMLQFHVQWVTTTYSSTWTTIHHWDFSTRNFQQHIRQPKMKSTVLQKNPSWYFLINFPGLKQCLNNRAKQKWDQRNRANVTANSPICNPQFAISLLPIHHHILAQLETVRSTGKC